MWWTVWADQVPFCNTLMNIFLTLIQSLSALNQVSMCFLVLTFSPCNRNRKNSSQLLLFEARLNLHPSKATISRLNLSEASRLVTKNNASQKPGINSTHGDRQMRDQTHQLLSASNIDLITMLVDLISIFMVAVETCDH